MDILILLYAKNGGGQRIFSGGKRGGQRIFSGPGRGGSGFFRVEMKILEQYLSSSNAWSLNTVQFYLVSCLQTIVKYLA